VSEFEYVAEGWGRQTRGWDVPGVEQAYRRRWSEFVAAVDGSATLGVAHEVPSAQRIGTGDPGWHNVVMTFGYVLARAARGRDRLSLLDWGGGPGHYAVLARALLPEVELDYHSRDLPRLTRFGREVLPNATFHEDDRCLDRTYELVVASDALHYVEDYPPLLAKLALAAQPWLYVALLPLVVDAASFVVQQRPDSYGYDTEYLGWVLNRDEFLEAARAVGLRLEREFLAPGTIDPPGVPEPAVHCSFLFSAVD
jgi:putative methyltransferase (TIGR04325 family)